MAESIPNHVLTAFHVERSGHITVVVLLNGNNARLIVDTGAGATCIDTHALEQFNLRLSKRSRRGGGVGSSTMQLTHIARHKLELAGLDLSSFRLHAIDLSHVNASLASMRVKPIVGVLGADILLGRNAVIDYGRRCIILSVASAGGDRR